MPFPILINNLKKKFGDEEIYRDLTLTLENGAITALVGPNGCGKSTLLKILAGLVQPDSGECRLELREELKFSYIFQNYQETLLPWKTAADNIALPLHLQKYSRAAVNQKIARLAKWLPPSLALHRYPYQLSGEQQQLIAFWRALITDPKLLFIDESFSALDHEQALRLRLALQEYHCEQKATVVIVSHNVDEAVQLAKTIIVLSNRPTVVSQIIDNSLPYPRTPATLVTDEFFALRRQVLNALHKVMSI